jgi:hypoxanthine phosphoribosyltransferase
MPEHKMMDVIFTQEQIEERAVELGRRISLDYAGKEVILVGILTGCVIWMAQLMKSIDLDTSVDFMSVSSYGAATKSSGIVKIIKDLTMDIEGRHVLIIEDIIDSGTTLDYLVNFLKGRNPASLKICTMLDKAEARKVEIDAEYIGFKAPNLYLIGYGLDANHRYRNLPYIAALKD